MAKSKILKELANGEIQIDIALRRLMLLANDIGDNELCAWADKELMGYDSTDELPEYRIIWCDRFYYSGIKGNSFNHLKMNDLPLPLDSIFDDDAEVEKYCNVRVIEPITNIIEKANMPPDTKLNLDFTHLQRKVYNKTHIQCVQIELRLHTAHMAGIVAKITQKLIKIFMKLDKEYGNFDDLDIDITNIPQEKIEKTKAEVQQIYNITINHQTDLTNAKIKGHKIKDSNIGSGTNTVEKAMTVSPTLQIDDLFGKLKS